MANGNGGCGWDGGEMTLMLTSGILWDSDAKAIRWVDLKVAEIHS